jgi:predicted anti-sigma-YlaC factor YlaD
MTEFDCAKSLAMLSEFHDGALDEERRALVRAHLALCPPCEDVFKDLDTIVAAALVLREEREIAFPDENLLWQRMALKPDRTIH